MILNFYNLINLSFITEEYEFMIRSFLSKNVVNTGTLRKDNPQPPKNQQWFSSFTNRIQSRSISFEVRESKELTFMVMKGGGNNDPKIKNMRENLYCLEAYEGFLTRLKPHQLNIFVKRTILEEGKPTTPGHLASFITNENAEVIEDSVISLHPSNNNFNFSRVLEYSSPIDKDKIFNRYTRGIKFIDLKEDLMKHYFSVAYTSPMDLERYVFSINISSIIPLLNVEYPDLFGIDDIQTFTQFIINNAREVKSNLEKGEYILCSGIVNTFDQADNLIMTEEKDSLNCVTAVLLALCLRLGKKNYVKDPSPQAGARGIVNFFSDTDLVKSLINRSLMEYKNDNRPFDITLEYDDHYEYRNKVYSSINKFNSRILKI